MLSFGSPLIISGIIWLCESDMFYKVICLLYVCCTICDWHIMEFRWFITCLTARPSGANARVALDKYNFLLPIYQVLNLVSWFYIITEKKILKCAVAVFIHTFCLVVSCCLKCIHFKCRFCKIESIIRISLYCTKNNYNLSSWETCNHSI